MTWQARILRVAENPVPNATAYMDVEFSDGTRSFAKTLKITTGEAPEDIVTRELEAIDALYSRLPDLPDTVVALDAVPVDKITMFQCRAMLIGAGLYEQAEALVQAQGGIALAAWEYSATVHRRSPLVAALAKQLGLTEDQIDAMFEQASQITV
jgi:hypothetical protein